MNSTVIPLAVPGELRSQIKSAITVTGLKQADVMRQSIGFGLPHLCAAYANAAKASRAVRRRSSRRPQPAASQP